MLALGVDDRRVARVMLVDEASGEVKWTVQADERGIETQVVMSPDTGRFVAIVMGIYDERWKLLDAASGVVHREGAWHDGTGACICAKDHANEQGCPVVAHTASIRTVAFSPCGRRLATGDEESTVILWDAQTGKVEQRMQTGDDGGAIWSLSFSVTGMRLASGDWNETICIWDVTTTTGVLLRTIPEEIKEGARPGCKVRFSPTNNTLASLHEQAPHFSETKRGQIKVWDIESGEQAGSFNGRNFVVFSPDGRTIATASGKREQVVKLVDVESRAERCTMVGHDCGVSSSSFSVHPKHQTLNPQPFTLNPQSFTLSRQP